MSSDTTRPGQETGSPRPSTARPVDQDRETVTVGPGDVGKLALDGPPLPSILRSWAAPSKHTIAPELLETYRHNIMKWFGEWQAAALLDKGKPEKPTDPKELLGYTIGGYIHAMPRRVPVEEALWDDFAWLYFYLKTNLSLGQ